MKTKNELIAKLISLTTKENKYPIAKQSTAYKAVLNAIETGIKHIRPVYFGSRVTMDNTLQIKSILLLLDIKFEFSNDAPKGGKIGNLITITDNII